MDFVWQLLFNMKGIPITAFTTIVGLIAAIVIHDTRKSMKLFTEYESEYATLDWRMWTAVNVSMITGIIWLLIMSVPSPDFKKQKVYLPIEVIKKVPIIRYAKERVVYKMPTYAEMYDKCIRGSTNRESQDTKTFCDSLAAKQALPPYRTLTRTIRVTVHDDYKTLFDNCMGKWANLGGNEKATEYTRVCVDYAAAGLPASQGIK